MYQVFSLLRRLAVSHIYATEAMLTSVDGAFHIKLDKPAEYLDLGKQRWVGPTDVIPVSSVSATSTSPQAAAIAIATMEGEVAEKVEASNAIYTFVAGPEEQDESPDGFTRRSYYACIRGVYRASSKGISRQKAAQRPRATFRKPPPGTVRLS